MKFTGGLRAFSVLLLAGLAPPASGQEAAGEALAAAVAAPLLGPAEAALRDGLEREAAGLPENERADLITFYAERGFAPFWAEAGAGRDATLLDALEAAGAQGLPPQRYAPARVAEALAAGASDPQSLAAAELAAMRAYLRYARDVSSGLLTPSEVDPEIEVQPLRPERTALLARLDAAPLDATLRSLEPADPDYGALKAEKARLEASALGTDLGSEAPEGPTLRLGDTGPRVLALRTRLAAKGHPAPDLGGGDPQTFDAGLDAALKAFQAEIGLDADGLAGRRTVAALNAGPEEALAQVLVNLERVRWMNGALEPRHLYANIPDYTVRLVEDGRTVFSSRTVVGEADETRTPEFSEDMTYLVVNPTWHIPDSIAQRVYLPKLKANPNTLQNSNMRIFTRGGTEINPGLVDFKQFASGNFPFRIKQNPSQANALGRVKFMFPNQFSIYLHDTPTRALFGETERAFSNGCVRVEDPIELAHLLLAGQVDDPAASFDAWLAAKAERNVTLERPIPVHLVYRTMFLDDAGALQRRFDVYGRDAAVFRALAAEGVTLPAAQG